MKTKDTVSIVAIALGLAATLFAGEQQEVTPLAETMKDVATSRVVGYAIANTTNPTNVIFTITKIWKGSEDGSALGITNGMQIRSQFSPTANLPDGAIVMFPQDASPSGPRSLIYVRHGRVFGTMTVQEFKTKTGL